MAEEEGEEAELGRPGPPLPPDDRLWRHPSELGHGTAPPSAWRPETPASPPLLRRPLAIAALASACLTGAVVAMGVMWVARPTRLVHETQAVRTTTAGAAASFSNPSVSTAKVAATLGPSLVQVQVGRADRWTTGTGVWLDEAGTVLVATPLLGGDPADAITVSRANRGAPLPATVLGSDPETGISVLRVSTTDGTPIEAGTADVKVGADVAVIGAARTTASSSQQRAVTAAIGTVGERVAVPPLVLHDALRLDRQVPADALGALVVDDRGRVVGVVVCAADDDGLAVVVPAHDALTAARELRNDGQVRRAWLGVRAVDLSPAEARLLDVAGGARLTEVTPGSPAAATGLRPDDVLVEIDGQQVIDASDLVVALRRWQPGERVEITWRRGLERHTADCTLGG